MTSRHRVPVVLPCIEARYLCDTVMQYILLIAEVSLVWVGVGLAPLVRHALASVNMCSHIALL